MAWILQVVGQGKQEVTPNSRWDVWVTRNTSLFWLQCPTSIDPGRWQVMIMGLSRCHHFGDPYSRPLALGWPSPSPSNCKHLSNKSENRNDLSFSPSQVKMKQVKPDCTTRKLKTPIVFMDENICHGILSNRPLQQFWKSVLSSRAYASIPPGQYLSWPLKIFITALNRVSYHRRFVLPSILTFWLQDDVIFAISFLSDPWWLLHILFCLHPCVVPSPLACGLTAAPPSDKQ